MAEEKIRTKKGLYMDSEIVDAIVFDGWSLFELYTKEFSFRAMQDNKFLSAPGLENIHIDCYRNRIETSNKPELFVFEFANRIGALMTYFFIESLNPRRHVKSDQLRFNEIEQFIKEVIPYTEFLGEFHRMLPVDGAAKSYLEVKENSLKLISEAYKNVYPNFYNFLDAGYLKFAEGAMLGSNGEKNSDCKHEWKNIYVHKVGNFIECRNCNIVKRSDGNAKI